MTQQTDIPARYTATDKGHNGLSLTNFTNTSEPQVTEGSIIEIGGSVYYAASDQSVTGWAGIGNGNDTYIYIDASGNLTFSTTVPTWEDDKQGWYNSNDRAVAGLYKVDATTYYEKWIYMNTGLQYYEDTTRQLVTLPAYMELENTTTGISASSSWTKTTYNSVPINRIIGASESSGVITLSQGRYKIVASISTTGINIAILGRVRDTTNSNTLLVSSGISQTPGGSDRIIDKICGEILLNGTTNIEIQYYSSGTAGVGASFSLGGEAARGIILQIWKIR